MSDDIKRIDIKEFWELGFIQEINRRLLHPCGLALEIILELNEDGSYGEAKLGGVWDYRDDPEGMLFSEDILSQEKADSVTSLWDAHSDVRIRDHNFVVQPIRKTNPFKED